MDNATNGSKKESSAILDMLQMSIHAIVNPIVDKAQNKLESIIADELLKLGINPSLTSLYPFAQGIADQYRNKLVGARIKAIVDGLVSEKPVEAEKGSDACDAYGMPAKTGSQGIITVTLPPNMTKDQRDKITDTLKHQLPADAQVVSLPHGVQMGRV